MKQRLRVNGDAIFARIKVIKGNRTTIDSIPK